MSGVLLLGAPVNPEKIREVLLMDDTELQEKLLLRLKPHLGLGKDGKVHIRDPRRYRQKDTILLYLLGVRFAAEAKLREADTVPTGELCGALGLDPKVAAARLTDLRNEQKVESVGRGESRIVFARALAILDEIEANMTGV